MRQRLAGVVAGEAAAVMGENIAAGGRAIYPFLARNPRRPSLVAEADGVTAAAAAAEARVHDVVDFRAEEVGQAHRREILVARGQCPPRQQHVDGFWAAPGQE